MSKNAKRRAPQIEQVLARVEPSEVRQATQGPFQMFLRPQLVRTQTVCCSQQGISDGRIVWTSGFPCGGYATKREFIRSCRVDNAMKIHRHSAKQRQVQTRIFVPLRKVQRCM